MKANKEPKIEIKDIDQNSYHVELTRITGTPQEPNVVHDIQVFTKKDFALFQRDVDQKGIGITGYNKARVVHDPTYKEPVNRKIPRSVITLASGKPVQKKPNEKKETESPKGKGEGA